MHFLLLSPSEANLFFRILGGGGGGGLFWFGFLLFQAKIAKEKLLGYFKNIYSKHPEDGENK